MKRNLLAKAFTLMLLLAWGLSGCNAIVQPTPAPLPTVVLDNPASAPAGAGAAQAPLGRSGVTASGNVAPRQLSQVSATTGGIVQAVNAASGDKVQAGQVLVRLAGSQKLEAAVEAAKLEMLSAQQAIQDLNDNAAQARSQAQLRLANAKDAWDTAEKRRGWKEYRVGNDNQIAVARADLIVAEDRVKQTEDVFGGYADNPEDNLNKAAALSALSAARTARDKALANLNYLLSLPNTIEVDKADAQLEVARTELAAAQQAYDKLVNGPDPDALALAQARLLNAKAQLDASQSALADLELKAPSAGTVSKVSIHSGEWVTPGQPVLVLADLDHLQIETTDLSERDVPQVSIGQTATIFVKALNQQLPGHVREIAPLADTLGGDVVYQTILDLDANPAGLRAGMSVEVQFTP